MKPFIWILALCILCPPLQADDSALPVQAYYSKLTKLQSTFLNRLKTRLQNDRINFSVHSISDGIHLENNGFKIAIGDEAHQELSRHISSNHFLSIFSNQNNQNALKISPSIGAQLSLISYLSKRNGITAPKVGYISNDKKPYTTQSFSHYASQLELETKIVSNTGKNPIKTFSELQGVDFILADDDPSIYNPKSIKFIIRSAYERNIPIIGFTKRMVKYGAIATTYSDMETLGNEIFFQINDAPDKGYKIRCDIWPRDFKVALNNRVLKSLDLKVDTNTIESEVREIFLNVTLDRQNGEPCV